MKSNIRPFALFLTLTGRRNYFSRLLLGFGLMLSFFQAATAAPGHTDRPGLAVPPFTITITKDYSVANSGTPDAFSITFSPDPSPELALTFIISGSSYTPVITTVNGVATLDFTSSVVGPVSVDIYNGTVSPANYITTVTLHFIAAPGPPDPSTSYLVVTQNPATADGVSQDIVEAVLYDIHGNAITNPPSTAVNFSIESGSATISATGVTSPGTNVAIAYFTSTVVGSVQVQGFTNGIYLTDQSNPANNYVTVQFVVPPPDPAKSYIVATVTPMPADGSSQDVVEAVVNNSLGLAVPDGTAVTFTIETGTATITTTGVTSGGVAIADFTSMVVGSVQVQATITVNGIVTNLYDQSNPANNYVTVQFVVPPPDPAKSYIVATVTPMPADGSSQDVVEAVVDNSLGQPVPAGTAVTFTIETGTATITTTGFTSGSTGIAIANFTSTVVGSVQVQATVVINGTVTNLYDQSNPANNFVTIKFITGPPVPGNPGGGGSGGTPPGNGGTDPGSGGNNTGPGSNYTLLFVRQDYQLADGTHQDSIIAYITDGSKHPISNLQVTFFIQTSPTSGSITTGAQFVGSTTVSTDDSGMARIAITSTMPGTAFVDATIVDPVSGNSVLIDGSYQIATFLDVPDFNNPLTTLSVVVYEALSDGLQQTMVKAHLVDLDGQVMPGQDVTFSIDSGSGKIITPQPVSTDANGDAFIQLVSNTPGYVLVTATVAVGGVEKAIKNGSPARVLFVQPNIYVPRVFTPNGDGVNDVLKPILVGMSAFHYFSVYNRWGNLIFTSQDPNVGWDGTFKGVAQPVETYLWIAEGVNTDGKTVVQKGMVSLVR